MTITINDKDYKLHFGCTSVEYFFNKVGVLEKNTLFNTRLTTYVLLAGIENEAERNDTPADVSYTEVYDYAEKTMFTKDGKELLGRIVKAFMDSQATKEAVENLKEMNKEVKKKLSTLKKSGPLPTAH